MADLDTLRRRAVDLANSRTHTVYAAAFEAIKRQHRTGDDSCMCDYCQHLPRYVKLKKTARKYADVMPYALSQYQDASEYHEYLFQGDY